MHKPKAMQAKMLTPLFGTKDMLNTNTMQLMKMHHQNDFECQVFGNAYLNATKLTNNPTVSMYFPVITAISAIAAKTIP